MTKPTSIAIYGIGAMGTLFAFFLEDLRRRDKTIDSKLGPITLYGHWKEQITRLRRNGLELTRLDGSTSTIPLNVTNRLATVPPADIVLVMVKSHQTERAAKDIRKILKEDGIVVSLQNGLGNLEMLSAELGSDRCFAGSTAHGATVLGPARTRHAGIGKTVIAGAGSHKLILLLELLNRAGLEVQASENAQSLIWGKLVVNAAINPVTAIFGIQNGELLIKETSHVLAISAAKEAAEVAGALDVKLPFADPSERVDEVCRLTAKNSSSMLQDIQRGAMTEVDAINGAVIRYGRETGIPTPVNELLLSAVLEKQAGNQIDMQGLHVVAA